MIRFSTLPALALAAVLVMHNMTSALACACCADHGHRLERPGDELEASQLEAINELEFAPDTTLRMSGDYPDSIKGFEPSVSGAYKIAARRDGGTWAFDISDDAGASGTLSFKMPKTIDRFEADFPVDGKQSGDAVLIKEWRLVAPVTGDGMFKAGLSKSARVRLILQGRGNVCATAQDFKSWQLVVSGPRESFTFLGRFK